MKSYKKIFLELIVFSYLYYTSSVTVVPSNTIDVIEGGGYTFGIEDDSETNICGCSYISNLDKEWANFEIRKPEHACNLTALTTTTTPTSNDNRKEFNRPTFPPPTILYKIEKSSKNIVSTRSLDCLIDVKYVNDQGPTKWSIIPDDWNKIFTEKVDFNVNFHYAVPLIFLGSSGSPETVVLEEGEDFFQYLNTNLTFESCNVIFNGNIKQLNLKSEETGVIKTSNKIDQQLSERISSLGRDRCGFKLKKAIPTDSITWTLTGITSDKKKYRAVFDATVYNNFPDSSLHSVEVVELGKQFTIPCGNVKKEPYYCKLYNPKGNLVYPIAKNEPCKYTISSFQVDHYGVWRCISSYSAIMKSIENTYKFIEKESPYMSTWVEQKGDYLSIGCQLQNSDTRLFNYCKLTSPDQQIFSLKPGRSTERYIALDTDFYKLKCGMEIKLPLKESENGMWRCESEIGGAFIDVGKHTKIDYQKYSKITTRIGQNLLILCEVPFYSSFCHIKAPNGTRYPVEDKFEPWLGRCSFKIEAVNLTDNGTWTCSYALKDGTPDEEILVEVTIADMLSYNAEVKATEDYPFNMLCTTGGLSLDYCQFLDPNGKSYNIDNNVNSTYISYYGQGLEYGECGIQILNAAKSDSGNWSCILKISKEKKEISVRLSVEVAPNLLSGSNIALTLGVTFGVVAITSLFALIAIRTYRQRKRARLEVTSTQPLNDSTAHDVVQGDIFSLNFPSQGSTNRQFERDDNHQHQF